MTNEVQNAEPVLQGNYAAECERGSRGDTLMVPVKLCNLPPFHAVASRLATLPEDERSDVKVVVGLVSGDPALAAEILFLANSSLFGFPARIQSLRHAVAVLGIDCVKQLAMTVAMRGLVRGSDPLVKASWSHSVACAVIASEIAPLYDCTAEQAYTAGLLHDIGRLGFLKSYLAEITPVLQAEYENAGEVMAAERAAINTTHGEAGAWLIEYWALPTAFCETCKQHHDALNGDDSAVLRVVKTACRLADAIGYAGVRYKACEGYGSVIGSMLRYIPTQSFPGEVALRVAVASRLAAFA